MIPLLLLAATLVEMPGNDQARFAACVLLAKNDPAVAVAQARDWVAKSTDVPARQCLGRAHVAAGQWTEAADTFESVAKDSQAKTDARAAGLWSLAGNAALAAADPMRARADVDKALALATLPPIMTGEALMDRARADVALEDLPAGRTDLDAALKAVPQDPFAWLLSATLARRQGELARAEKDIAQAAALASDDPAVMLERGNIAWAAGHGDVARAAWTRAAQVAPDTEQGKLAAERLTLAADPQPRSP